jgi:hypothetical protein
MKQSRAKSDGVVGNRERLSKSRLFRFEVIGDRQEIAFRHPHQFRESARARRHREKFARWTQVRTAGETIIASAAGDQRIDCDTGPGIWTADNYSGCFMPENERRRPT